MLQHNEGNALWSGRVISRKKVIMKREAEKKDL